MHLKTFRLHVKDWTYPRIPAPIPLVSQSGGGGGGCRRRLKRKKKKARLSSFHRPPRAFYFLDVLLFLLRCPAAASAAERDNTANKCTNMFDHNVFFFLKKDRFDP